MSEFRISDVNGIADLTIKLDGPGVYVARGPNGAGKSSAIEALKAASGDDKAKAEPSDGESKGKVEGSGGVVLAVGHRRRLNGLPSVRLVSTGAIGMLIDPGIKDSTLAARARLKALLQLMPLPADDAARMELTANDEELQNWIKGDPSTDAMDLAEAVRKRANELANDLEKRSAEAKGEEESLIGLLKGLGILDFQAGEVATAAARATQLTRDAERMQIQSRARQDLEARQAKIRETAGPRPDLIAAGQALEAGQKLVQDLTAQLASAQTQLLATKNVFASTQEAIRLWDAQAYILKQPVEGPTPSEAAEKAEEALAANAAVEAARKLDAAKTYQVKANAAKDLCVKSAERAKKLRAIVQGCASALGRLLERRGLPGLMIEDGRLAVKAPAGPKDFDLRLSFGERVRTALGIALAGMGEHPQDGKLPILPLEPTFWLALDAERKAEVSSIAKERGVCLVTEEPDSGSLRVERL